MELKQLEYFVACADTLSFSKAANLLYTTQSNVSKVIKNLELELNAELFERRANGILLSERGRAIYEYACNTLDSAQKVFEVSQEKSREILNLSCNPSSWFAAAFCEFYMQHEKEHVSYQVLSAGTGEIIRRISSGLDQLGFVYVMEEKLPALEEKLSHTNLVFLPLARTRFMFYFGGRTNLEDFGISPDMDAEEARKQLLLQGDLELVQAYEDEFTLKSYWTENRLGKKGLTGQRVAVQTNSDYIMNELLRNSNLGNISGGYLSHAEQALITDGISLFGEKDSVLFGAILPKEAALSPKGEEFLEFIRQRLDE